MEVASLTYPWKLSLGDSIASDSSTHSLIDFTVSLSRNFSAHDKNHLIGKIHITSVEGSIQFYKMIELISRLSQSSTPRPEDLPSGIEVFQAQFQLMSGTITDTSRTLPTALRTHMNTQKEGGRYHNSSNDMRSWRPRRISHSVLTGLNTRDCLRENSST